MKRRTKQPLSIQLWKQFIPIFNIIVRCTHYTFQSKDDIFLFQFIAHWVINITPDFLPLPIFFVHILE